MQGRLVAADSSAARLRGLAGTARSQGLADDFLDVRPGDLRELRQGLGAASLFDRGAPPPLVDGEHAGGLQTPHTPASAAALGQGAVGSLPG